MGLNLPFAILRPVHQPAREHLITHLGYVTDLSELDEIVTGWDGVTPMALDFETRGDVDDEDSRVVTVALSDNRGTVTVDFRHEGGEKTYEHLMRMLHSADVPLLAHNAYFDAAWPLRDFGLYHRWICTYATYRHLANEGWDGQRYGLAHAQIDLLNWEASNKDAVAEWLSANGCVKSHLPKKLIGVDPSAMNEKDYKKFLSCADKGQLWKVPADVLMHYNALDADSTWLLWTYVLAPRLEDFQELKSWMLETYPPYMKILIEQKLRGIQLDMPYLVRYEEALRKRLQGLTQEFLTHPEIGPWVQLYELSIREDYRDREPSMYAQNTALPEEPPKFTKTGAVTKRWVAWKEKKDKQDLEGRPLSGNWVDWKRKMDEFDSTPQFSLTSDLAMGWLLYEWIGIEVKIRTETGIPGLSIEAISHAPGADILALWSTINKELTSVESLIGIQKSGIYYPKVRTPGTHTGRLSGSGGYNCQNVPKSPVLTAFAARPGHKILVADIAALENMVVTELSGDETLMKLFGPDADPNQDAHLHLGSKLPGGIGDAILATGYDPDNPIKEIVEFAKKTAKQPRDIAKTTSYSLVYGASAARLQAALAEENVHLELDICEGIKNVFWETRAGVRAWYKQLQRQWRQNRGWFLSGMGRPICVDESYLRDVGSRAVQSTGHDAFILLLLQAARTYDREGVRWFPWNADLHDALMFEIPEEDVPKATELWPGIVAAWNEELGGVVPLKADPAFVDNWAQDKFSPDDLVKLNKKFGVTV